MEEVEAEAGERYALVDPGHGGHQHVAVAEDPLQHGEGAPTGALLRLIHLFLSQSQMLNGWSRLPLFMVASYPLGLTPK